MDGGLRPAQRFLAAHLKTTVDDIESGRVDYDAKSALQELCLKQFHSPPRYRVVAERGPAHAKQFEVSVMIRGQHYATGKGMSKKSAEQACAQAALQALRERDRERHEPQRTGHRETLSDGGTS